MNTRIRYNEQPDNILVSKDTYKVRGTEYQVHLYLSGMAFDIVSLDDTSNPVIVQSGQKSTVNQLKIAAKKALTDLGVKFKEEYRSKKEVKVLL